MKDKSTKSNGKKPIFKKWWFWVIIVVILVAMFWLTQGAFVLCSSVYNCSLTNIKAYPRRLLPLHLLRSNLFGSLMDKPIPQI